MRPCVAFDIYGTLIDTQGVAERLQEYVGERANTFARLWREKQLEYSFRRGLMKEYEDFNVCIADAFDYTNAALETSLNEDERRELLAAYLQLPAFVDVIEGLEGMRNAGMRMFAFSNGRADVVAGLLAYAGLSDYFEAVVSVDEIKSYKPDPAVYKHFLQRAGVEASESWLVSSNPFDVIGALAVGMRAAWIQRSPTALFDPWSYRPTLSVTGLAELEKRLAEFC